MDTKRRKYDRDFKRNAVLLCSEPGRTVVDVAKNLDTIVANNDKVSGSRVDTCIRKGLLLAALKPEAPMPR